MPYRYFVFYSNDENGTNDFGEFETESQVHEFILYWMEEGETDELSYFHVVKGTRVDFSVKKSIVLKGGDNG